MSDINEMNVGPRWYVAHTYSGYENKVKASLEKIIENRGLGHLIFDISIPTEIVIEKNGDVFTVKSEAGESVEGKYLINCAGCYADKLAEMIGDKFYEFGSDTYARKDVTAVAHSLDDNGEVLQEGRNGLMTADDKTLLYNIGAIDLNELNTLLQ